MCLDVLECAWMYLNVLEYRVHCVTRLRVSHVSRSVHVAYTQFVSVNVVYAIYTSLHLVRSCVTACNRMDARFTHQMYLACNLDLTFHMVVLLTCVYIGVNFGLHVHQYSTVNTRAHRYVRFEDTISRMRPMEFEVVCDEKQPLSAVYVYVRDVVCTHTHDCFVCTSTVPRVER